MTPDKYDTIIRLINTARLKEATGLVKVNAGGQVGNPEWTAAGQRDLEDAEDALRGAWRLLDVEVE